MNTVAKVLLLIWLCGTASLQAGDGNPFAPKKITIDLDFPYQDLSEYKFQQAKLIIEFKPSEGRDYYSQRLEYAPIRSLTVDLGTGKLSIPVPILDRMRIRGFDPKFTWFAHGYDLSFEGSFQAGDEKMHGEFHFRWEKGKLTQAFLRHFGHADRKDLTSFFPELFPAKQGL
jgi:hypothetical protein